MKEGLDLVEVNPTATPPVCKLLDFSKYTYESMRQAALKRREEEPEDEPESSRALSSRVPRLEHMVFKC